MQPSAVSQPGLRVRSVDIIRGAVMVLMAIDHVRVYSGLPAGGETAGIFFTRWVTHFCAPAFVFLAGTSAFLYGVKVQDKKQLTRYLVTRGLLLVVLELTVIRFSWTFNLNYLEFVLAGVIWMLGWCMVLLAAFIRMRPVVVGMCGVSIILLQQVFSKVPGLFPESFRTTFTAFWEFIYPTGGEAAFGITVLYVLVPWIGVMAAGYGFGQILLMDAQKMRKLCLWIGLSAIALFLVAGTAMALNNGNAEIPFIYRLLHQDKYPASQLFLLMTLGPVIAITPFAEKVKGTFANIFEVFGRVPFFYYILHIPLIHISALAVQMITLGTMHHEWFTNAPFVWIAEPDRWSLWLLYLVFIIDTVILYFLCRWYAIYKASNPQKKLLQYV